MAAVKNELASIHHHSINPEFELPPDKAEIQLLTIEIERELLKRYEKGICCFSSEFNTPLLWRHYGDQHQGICIWYDIIRAPKPTLHEVSYGGNRIVKTSLALKALIHRDAEAETALDKSILLRKVLPWQYEKEWRLIDQQGLHDSPLRLAEVTFGLRCPSPNIYLVVTALNRAENEIVFYKIREERGSFELHRQELDVSELQVTYPVTAQSVDLILRAFGAAPFENNLR